jgi:hypothetical protein
MMHNLIENRILFLFLFITVLYYFLRFQWGWDFIIISMQISLLVILSGIGIFKFILMKKSNRTNNDLVFLLIAGYSVFLLLITSVRAASIEAISYSIKDYILPLLLMFYYSNIFKRITITYVFKVVAIIGTLVSLIYFLEFVNKIYLNNDVFQYTIGMRGVSGSIGETLIREGGESFFRLAGPLSHANSTAIIIAAGLLSLIPFVKNNSMIKIVLGFDLIVFLLTGSRTAWIAFIFSFLYYKGVSIKLLAKAIVFSIVIFSTLLSFFPAISGLLNLERFILTIGDILNKVELLSFSRLYNILVGSGFNYPGMSTAGNPFYNPILEDDFFLIQLITIFGLIPLAGFFVFIFKKRHPLIKRNDLWRSSQSILIIFTISIFHTNAIIRPQIFPIFILFVVLKKEIEYRLYLSKKS